MIELNLASQFAQDQAEFAVEPHPQLYPYEREQWRRLYDEIMSYNAEEPQNVGPREGLRMLHRLAVTRQDFWASQQRIAPAPPRPG